MKDHRSIGIQSISLYNSYEFYFGKRDRPMQSVPLRAFHNALRILRSLDYHEVPFLSDSDWALFRDNPYEFFITTTDGIAAQIWAAIQKRQPSELRQDKLAATQKPIYELKFNDTPDHAEHDWLVLKDGTFIKGFATSNAATAWIADVEAERDITEAFDNWEKDKP